MSIAGRVLALSGGVGGAKLALGLANVLPPGGLTIVANTGDDFEYLGLHISPDLDTLLYALSDRDDLARGWGRRDESWAFMAALGELGGETWFQLGDRDLATHLERTRRLSAGQSLSEATGELCRALGLASRLLPMTDDRVRTRLRTDEGWLDFQDYFVRRRCEPTVTEIAFEGAAPARAHPDFLSGLADPDLRAVVICPSNPLVSIEPILALSGVREALAACRAPVVAVSPIVRGEALKGPAAKMLRELRFEPSAATIAERYRDLIDLLVVEPGDEPPGSHRPWIVGAPTIMKTLEDKERLARIVLAAADSYAAGARQARAFRGLGLTSDGAVTVPEPARDAACSGAATTRDEAPPRGSAGR